MDVGKGNAVIGTVARAVTLPIQAINPLAAGDGVITLPLTPAPEPVGKSSASQHHTRSGADSGAPGRTSAFAAATANANAHSAGAEGNAASAAIAPVVVPDTSTAAARSRGFNLYA